RTGTLLLDPKNIVISQAPVGVFPQFQLIDPHPTQVGGFGNGLRVLSTGNVVVVSPNDNFGGTSAGAVYLFDGLSGALLSSLVGSNVNDRVGFGFTPLTNGNYLVSSLYGTRGAVTWADSRTGVSGTVSDANSLVGSHPFDEVGNAIPLSNGNYVVISS